MGFIIFCSNLPLPHVLPYLLCTLWLVPFLPIVPPRFLHHMPSTTPFLSLFLLSLGLFSVVTSVFFFSWQRNHCLSPNHNDFLLLFLLRIYTLRLVSVWARDRLWPSAALASILPLLDYFGASLVENQFWFRGVMVSTMKISWTHFWTL